MKWERKYKNGFLRYELVIGNDVYTLDDNISEKYPSREWKLHKNGEFVCFTGGYRKGKDLVSGMVYR